jgi:hypothetical protein
MSLESKLRERDELSAKLKKNFDSATIDALTALQKEIRTLQNAQAKTAGASTDGETATITLIRGGKDNEQVVVPAGTSLESVIAGLGWASAGMEYKRIVGPGVTETVKSPKAEAFGPGTHDILVTPRVVGG